MEPIQTTITKPIEVNLTNHNQIVEINLEDVNYTEEGYSEYDCPNCKYDGVKPSFEYCPNCGIKISWK
jgi:hypothetical protein